MSLSKVLTDVRSILSSDGSLTTLVPSNKITLGRRPQRDTMPGITYAIGNVDYDETKQSYAEAISYRVDITIYCDNAGQSVEIQGRVKNALLAGTSSHGFEIRILDERYFVDVDDNHLSYVSVIFKKFEDSYGLLLDKYPNAAAAYSLRKLRTEYNGPALTVRKTVNGSVSTKDIYFNSSGILDTEALEAFAPSGANTYVEKWWDQSGRGNHATAGDGNRPIVTYQSGLTTTIPGSGVPTIWFPETYLSYFEADHDDLKTQDRFDAFMHYKTDNDSYMMFSVLPQSGRYSFIPVQGAYEDGDGDSYWYVFEGSYDNYANRQLGIEPELYVQGQLVPTTQAPSSEGFDASVHTSRGDLWDAMVDGAANTSNGSIESHINASTEAWGSESYPDDRFTIGGYSLNLSVEDFISEIVIYTTDQSANRTDIEGDMNKYYKTF